MSAHEYRLRVAFEHTVTLHDEDCEEGVTVDQIIEEARKEPDDWAVSECLEGEMVEFSIEPLRSEVSTDTERRGDE